VKVRALFGSIAAALGLVAFGGIASIPANAQAGDAKVRVVHFSPDAPAVDVYVDGKVRSKNLAYERASPYIDIPAGPHTFEVRPAGAAVDSTPVINAQAELAAGKSYTLAAIGKLASIQGKLYEDDTTAPGAGKVKLRVIHNAPDVPAVDVGVKGGDTLVKGLAFPNASAYLELPAGNYEVEVRAAGATTALLSSTVVLAEGGVYTVAAIGGGDKAAKLRGLIDLAAGAAPATTAAATTETSAAGTDTTVPAEPAETTPPDTEPADTAPADTEPAETTPPDTEPADTAPADTEPADTEPAETAPPDTEAATVPAGGAGTGAGGLTGTGGALTMAGLGAIAIATLGMAAARRRRA
jgi:hypothetical protein